jgi:hypothetical protein
MLPKNGVDDRIPYKLTRGLAEQIESEEVAFIYFDSEL